MSGDAAAEQHLHEHKTVPLHFSRPIYWYIDGGDGETEIAGLDTVGRSGKGWHRPPMSTIATSSVCVQSCNAISVYDNFRHLWPRPGTQQTMSATYPGHFVERSRQQRGIVQTNESRQSARYSRQNKDDSLVTSYVFHQQDQSVQQEDIRLKYG